ncbi:MAG TPA: prolyl oligopeptidase family serine peptidase [Rhizomicrobium sp.]
MRLGKWMALALGIGAMALPGLCASAGEDRNKVSDPYLWLEDIHGAKSLAWVKQQNARALALLEAGPDYKNDYDDLLAIMDAKDRIPFGALNHQYVFNFWQDAQNPKGIWRRTTIADYPSALPQWETLLDIDKLSADEHESWVFKGAACTPTLTRCLVSLSRGGGDAVVVREFGLASKSFVKDGFTLPEAKSVAAFLDDDTILFGTDFGKGSLTNSGYPRIVKIWHRGEAIAAAKLLLEGKLQDVTVSPTVLRQPGGSIPIIMRTPSFFETEYYLPSSDGKWSKLAVPLSAVLQGMTKGQLVFTVREDWKQGDGRPIAKGSLIAFPLNSAAHPDITVLYAPEPRVSVEEVATGRDAVYASMYRNVVGSIRAFRFDASKDAWSNIGLDLPAGGATHVVATNDFGPEAQFRFESFLAPTTLYADDGDDRPQPIKSLPARFDAAGLVTEQHEATSRDGTKIPYFVVRKADAPGPQPMILYGYGGFEISLAPRYWESVGKLWLSRGGAFAIANIRGGGEFGPAWHDAALTTNRQKAFDDFAAVAADLSRRGITTPKQLGLMGGSNGGLLVSAVMTQHPELLGAVVCQVPLTDMIRYTHIGAGASWIAEYGDPADPRIREAILKYSPYQNVKADVKYPPVFFVTATSDDRVTPVHARKMAAKMLGQRHDVLFFENTEGGHAAAADHRQAAQMWALTFVYFGRELGLGRQAPAEGPSAPGAR